MKAIGYIITNDDQEMPLQYYDGVLAVGDCAALFSTEEAANSAIKNTIKWARRREQEPDIAPSKLTYAQTWKYQIWPVMEEQK